MKIVKVSAVPMSAPVPEDKRHRTDLGTEVKSDATLIRVETDNGLTGMGAALGPPPIVAAIVEHELAAESVGEDPIFSERIYEKMYNVSRSRPALERGITQADESRRRGVIIIDAAAGRGSALGGDWRAPGMATAAGCQGPRLNSCRCFLPSRPRSTWRSPRSRISAHAASG